MQEYNKMEDPMKSSKYTQVCYDLSVRGDENHLTDVKTYTIKLGHAHVHD